MDKQNKKEIDLRKPTKEFRIEIGTRFKDEKRDITIIDREYKDNPYHKGRFLKYYKYICNKCGFDCGEHYNLRHEEYRNEHWILENTLVHGSGCTCCANNIVVEGINDIPTTAHWMVKYFQGGIEEAKMYTCSSNKKIQPICPDCGRVKDIKIDICNIYASHSINCFCSDSIRYPNKFAHSVLEQLRVDFVTEYTPEWCKFQFQNKTRQGSYDFYFELNNKKYIIEMDGGFHSKDNPMNGQTKKDSRYIDNEKDKLAKEHDIEVIRIDCDYNDNNRFEHIKNNILNSEKLNDLFDFNDFNWNECAEFACSNLIKIASEIKRNNPDMNCQEIGQIMGYDKYTIIKWLNKGHELGFCYYNGKEEKRKGNLKSNETNRKLCSKVVEIFKDGASLGVFSSCHELQAKSQELFGTKLLQGHISEVCRGEKELYKSYTFRYLTPQEIEEIQSEDLIQII